MISYETFMITLVVFVFITQIILVMLVEARLTKIESKMRRNAYRS